MKPIFFTVLAALLSANSLLATAWVARHAMSHSGFQAERNRWSAEPYRLRPTCISGYDTPEGPRYAAVWEKQLSAQLSAQWSTGHGMTDAEYHERGNALTNWNIFPVFVSGFMSGGVRYYNAIWDYRSRGHSVSVLGASRNTLDTLNLLREAQGYALTYVSTFTEDDLPRYNAIWTRGAFGLPNEFEARYGLTAAQYQSQFNQLAGAGYRLTAQTVSFEGGVERIAAVFRKPFGVAWWSASGITAANYEGETWNAYYQGYRPAFVSVHPQNGELRFNAAWTHNGGMTPNQVAPLEGMIRADMQSNNIAGLSLAISRNGRLVYAKGFGQADKQAGVWMNPRHRLRIASVSKTVTAAALLRLRDSGALSSLDRTVFGSGAILSTTYGTLPYTAREQAITVRHLLNHTTGWMTNAFVPLQSALIGAQLDTASQPAAPGTQWAYLNNGYVMAGRVIEQLAGKTYEQYVRDNLLAPCGVTDMALANQTLAGRQPREVRYYNDTYDPYAIDTRLGDAAGGWLAKPMDLLLLLRRIDGNPANTDVISAARFAEMQMGAPGNSGYGLGVGLNPGWWGHNGAMQGTGALLIQRDDGLAFAMLRNQDTTNDAFSWQLRAKIAAAIDTIPGTAWPAYDLFPTANAAFDDWTAANFDVVTRSHPGLQADIWGPGADPDGDGFPNAVEAGFGLNPLEANSEPYKASRIGNDFVLRWRRSVPQFTHGVQLETQIAHALSFGVQIWLPGPSVQTASGVINPVGFTTLETRLPMGIYAKAFQRFRATTP